MGNSIGTIAFRVLTFPIGFLFLLAPQSLRVSFMERMIREESTFVQKVIHELLRLLAEPYILARDFLEMQNDTFGFMIARKEKYGQTFVHSKRIVITDYNTVRSYLTSSKMKKAHLSAITGMNRHKEGPANKLDFLISNHDEYYQQRRTFLMHKLFLKVDVQSIGSEVDDMMKACKSLQDGSYDNADVQRTMTRVLHFVCFGVDLPSADLDVLNEYSVSATILPTFMLNTILRGSVAKQHETLAKAKEVYRKIPMIQKLLESLQLENDKAIGQPYTEDKFLTDVFEAMMFAGAFGLSGTCEPVVELLKERPDLVSIIGEEVSQVAKDGIITARVLSEGMTRSKAIVWEGMRLKPTPMAVIGDVTDKTTSFEMRGREVPVPAGTVVTLSIQTACRDPEHFPNPEKVVLDRPIDKYINFNGPMEGSPRGCMGKKFAIVLVQMFVVNWAMQPHANPASSEAPSPHMGDGDTHTSAV